MNSIGLVVMAVTYLELEPKYLCTTLLNPVPFECDSKVVCADNDITSFEVNWSSPFSLNNWVEQLNMYCMDGKYIGLIGALAFLGSAIACAILPILGDKIGRYPVFIVTQAF